MAYRINDLIKDPSEYVFVLNTSVNTSKYKRPTNVAFEINYANQTRSVMIMDSWIPQDLSEQAPKNIIMESPSFRDGLNRGHFELVPPQEALELLKEEDAVLERQRLKNKYNSVIADLDMEPVSPRDIVVKKAEDDNISSMVKDLCVREDIEPVAVYARLRSAEKSLSKDEWVYISSNLNSTGRNEKINKLIAKNISKT